MEVSRRRRRATCREPREAPRAQGAILRGRDHAQPTAARRVRRRRLDAAAHELIVIELTSAAGLGRAIDDRLTRAASGIVTTTDIALARAVAEVLQAKPSTDPRRR